MDWLEEQIEKIKNRVINGSFTGSFIGYSMLALVGAYTLYLFTGFLCTGWIQMLYERYGNDIWSNTTYKILHFFKEHSFMVYTILSLAVSCRLFYARRIRPALDAVREAASYIAIGDLGHEISYSSQDELGEICNIFEKMRYRLIREKKSQWENWQKQQEINGIFAHDVRTPLTVIKGYTEFLQKYIPQGRISEQQLLEKLEQMHFQEERLLEFTKTMNRIQNIEERELSLQKTNLEEICRQLQEIAESLKEQFAGVILIQNRISVSGRKEDAYADSRLILEVFDNLISNAMRYANTRIEVIFQKEQGNFNVYVKDDGEGFSERALREATNIYYGEEENSKEHFGIGLYVSQMLCKKHEGELSIMNSVEKGAVVAARFAVNVDDINHEKNNLSRNGEEYGT